MRRTAAAVAVLLAAVLLPLTTGSAGQAAGNLPPKATWSRDVRNALAPAPDYLSRRVAAKKPGERLAIVLDIDNTSIATRYSWPDPVRPTLALARLAVRKKVTVFFVTGRSGKQLNGIGRVLTRAGYRYAGVCGRKRGEKVALGKQRCRRSIAAKGYTITANVGNRSTDFTGPTYERAFQLPNYGNALS